MVDAADEQLIDLPTGKPHVSASEARMWYECSWKHKLVQVKKIDLSYPGQAAAFGTAIHEAMEHFLRTRIVDVDIAHRAIDRLWDRCGHKDVVIPRRDDLDVFLAARGLTLEEACAKCKFDAKSRKQAHKDADLIMPEVVAFMEETFPGWEYVSAEMALYEPTGVKGTRFKGYIDGVIKANDKNGKPLVWIIDWKTSAWGWRAEKKSDPTVQAQLVLYKHFWMQKNADPDMKLRDVRCGFVLLKRSAKPGQHCELVKVSVGEVPIKRSLTVINNMIASVKRGIAIKNRRACKFCEYEKTIHCT